jgi:glycerol-3-phosphate O-acyltransferase
MRNDRRDRVVNEVHSRVLAACVRQSTHAQGLPLDVLINDTLYHEQKRMETDRKSPRRGSDQIFWAHIKRRIKRASEHELRTILARIIGRYTMEILGNFNATIYDMTTRIIPKALPMMLNAMSPGRMTRPGKLPSMASTIHLQGDLDAFRRCNELGTVICTPTHVSNLDSMVVAWALLELDMPPFSYGAGLNLFSNRVMSFFLRNLGAYRVDRLKTAPLYKDVLKEYTTVSLELGQPNLFFPAGTRVRSGEIDQRLKLGLLSSGLRAYINNEIHQKERPKIFIVPCNLNYHLVLEAETLIEDHLKRTGKGRFIIDDDESSRPRQIVRFFQELMHLDSQISVSFGAPIDPFGNSVDEEGESIDARGRRVDVRHYIHVDGRPQHSPQRDRVYTEEAGEVLRRSFKRNNVALSTNVVAFAAFAHLRRQNPNMDLYRLLRTAGGGAGIEMSTLAADVNRLTRRLQALAKNEECRLGPVIAAGDPMSIINDALRHFGTYHHEPVLRRRGDRVFSEHMNLLLYYRNRLVCYEALDAGGDHGND